MKAIAVIVTIVLCLIVKSEILSLFCILAGAVAFFCKIGGENPHEFF